MQNYAAMMALQQANSRNRDTDTLASIYRGSVPLVVMGNQPGDGVEGCCGVVKLSAEISNLKNTQGVLDYFKTLTSMLSEAVLVFGLEASSQRRWSETLWTWFALAQTAVRDLHMSTTLRSDQLEASFESLN